MNPVRPERSRGRRRIRKGVIPMVIEQERRFDISGIGPLFFKSLKMFAERLEDENGRELRAEDLALNQKFYVVFSSGTGPTRTSGSRII
ncbi:MAG: hypothetical protein ACLFRG_12000 [Desulfococcaceae bacterium]